MLALLLLLSAPPNPAYAVVEDDPNLPRVLLIGDSISIGYTVPVREKLAGVANVHRPPMNCGPSSRGVVTLDRWLGEGKWDVIHWNFGLHDLKFIDDEGNRATPETGHQQVPPEQYRKNLRDIGKRLKATGATVIWRNTTPVPDGTGFRRQGDAVTYNQIAAEVMTELGISTHDLYTYAKEHEAEIQRPQNVHYTSEGSDRLGAEVARVIREALPKPAE